MEKIKINFRKDVVSGEGVPVNDLRKELKEKKNKNYYLSEIADYYYQNKYDKNILEILKDYYEIPRCPVTGDLVSYKLTGSILFGKYSSSCDVSDMTKHIAENNNSYKTHVERMKIDRKGEGNPMYGATAWNDGLTKETDNRVKKISEDRKGIEFSDETLKKMSKSAKVREIHGHTGHKHSEESKQIMREKTIARFKSGSFPQTNSLPHRETRKVLEEIFGEVEKDFQEEFGYGGFVFDFKVGKYLIEVQGDYFHCNPETRHAIPKSDMQRNNLKRDERKRNFVEESGEYELIEVWENDIVNNIEKIKICLNNLKK
jgi:hypothetical protein